MGVPPVQIHVMSAISGVDWPEIWNRRAASREVLRSYPLAPVTFFGVAKKNLELTVIPSVPDGRARVRSGRRCKMARRSPIPRPTRPVALATTRSTRSRKARSCRRAVARPTAIAVPVRRWSSC